MRSLSRPLITLALAGLVLVPALPAIAAETAASDFVIVRPDTVVDGDLYAGGIEVIIEGTVDGDLLALAAEEITISGKVSGSVVAIAPRVIVTGEIDGSLRVLGGRLTLAGVVNGDIVQATGTSRLGTSSRVGGEVLAWTGSMVSLGSIGDDLTGNLGALQLAGAIGRDVDVSVTRLEVVDSLTVGGDLGYRSRRDASGLADADVGGVTVKKTPLPQNIRVRALGFFSRLLVVIFLTVSAVTVVYSWPERTRSAVAALANKPWKSWVYGLLVFLLPVLIAGLGALIVAIAPSAAAIPFLLVMVPLVLAVSGVVLLLTLFAGVPAVTWLGGKLRENVSINGAVAIGSGLVALVWFIPAVGWLVPLVVLPLGMGAWIRSWKAVGA